jgi:hypothetical protein
MRVLWIPQTIQTTYFSNLFKVTRLVQSLQETGIILEPICGIRGSVGIDPAGWAETVRVIDRMGWKALSF